MQEQKPGQEILEVLPHFIPASATAEASHETINQRITDCFERSMNGKAPDSNSREMKAMNAYISWLGKDVTKGKKPAGAGLEILTLY